jgi:hypothetical protein
MSERGTVVGVAVMAVAALMFVYAVGTALMAQQRSARVRSQMLALSSERANESLRITRGATSVTVQNAGSLPSVLVLLVGYRRESLRVLKVLDPPIFLPSGENRVISLPPGTVENVGIITQRGCAFWE